MHVAVEICVSSLEEAQLAAGLGADAIEVCTWLSCGGVTPSLGLLESILQVPIAGKRVLVRPCPGGFHYGTGNRQVMLADIDQVQRMGLTGVVTGALTEHGDLDATFMGDARERSAGAELTFHRAIDVARDHLAVLDACIGTGIDRILSSGGCDTALAGSARLKQLMDRAGGRLRITAAGGIGPSNVVEVVERTGVREVHLSAQRISDQPLPVALSSSSHPADRALIPDHAKIEGVLNALLKAGLR